MKRKRRSLFTILLATLIVLTMLPTTAFAASNKVPSKANVTKVSASTNAATVKWKKAKNATSYRIYYKPNGTNDWITVANVSGKKTSYTHKNNKKTPLVGGKKYAYAVRAYNKSSKKWSNYGSAKSVTIPAVPGKTNVTSVKAIAKNKVTITWNKTTNATSYRVYYKKSGAKKWSTLANVGSNTTSYTHTSNKKASLSAGKKYVYTVRAYNKSSKKWGSYNTKGVTVTIPKKNTVPTTPSEQPTPKPQPSTPSNPTPTPKPNKPSNPTPTPKPSTPTHTHSYEWVVTSQPTCTAVGTKEYKCKTCGNVADTTTIPKTSHTAGTPVKENEQPATCTYEGSYVLKTYCTVCHTLLDSKNMTTPKADHQWELLDDSNPTCESNGYTDYVCKVCAEMKTVTKLALGHDYGEEKVVEQPTMYLTGYKKKECNRCGHAEQTTIPKLTTPVRSEQEVYNILMSFQKKYPEDTWWDENNWYTTNRGDTINACNAFAWMLSDAAFGYARVYEHHNLDDIHVGDFVYSTNSAGYHVSIVLKVNENSVTIAEGNADGKTNWFAEFPKKYIEKIGTRY